MRGSVAVVAVVCALAVAVSAQAGAVKRLVWVKASATWTAQAKTKGLTATCQPWVASGAALVCEFTRAGKVTSRLTLGDTAEPCIDKVSVYAAKTTAFGPRVAFVRSQDANVCKLGWQKTLPAPS